MRDKNSYIGQVLEGRYRVEQLLGEGGMGAVYEGRHIVVGKRVAIKLLHAEFASNEEVLKRFYREAQAAAAIGHKNIIDILDVGVTAHGDPYLVMEYLEGEDLESMLARTGPVGLETACGILEPAMLALGAAHAKGIVHRDLKPANIFLVRAEGGAPAVKLIDFGISKFSGGTGKTKLTQTGSLLGTPAYMSPEQARGEIAVDHRTDIYAMGVILYQMLTGELPFQGDNYNTLLINVLTAAPRPLRDLKPDIPVEAEALVLRELSKNPADRSQTALQMLASFKDLAAYRERESGMSLLGMRIKIGVASGDLGVEVADRGDGSSASRVLSQMAKVTPGGWSHTASRSRLRPGVLLPLAGAALLVAGLVALVLTRGLGAQWTQAAAPAAATVSNVPGPSLEQQGALIAVEGVPAGAKVFYEDAEMPMNPFPVEKRSTVAIVRIEASGYVSLKVGVLPTENRTITVTMARIGDARAEGVGQAIVAEGISEARLEQGRKQRETASRRTTRGGPAPDGSSKSPEPSPVEEVASVPAKTLSRDDVQKVMAPLAAKAHGQCAGGTVRVVGLKLQVAGNGSVVGTSVAGPAAGTAAGACVEALARAVSFPSFAGGTVTLEYPVVLEDKPSAVLPATLGKGEVASVMSRVADTARSTCADFSSGTITTAVIVKGDGTVLSANPTGEFAGSEVGKCVAGAVRAATFPRFSNPTLSFSYPIVISARQAKTPPKPPEIDEASGLPKTPGREAVSRVMAPVVAGARRECGGTVKETVQLKLTIRSDGTVIDVKPIGPAASTATGECVARQARRAVFAPFANPTFTLSYPVVLN